MYLLQQAKHKTLNKELAATRQANRQRASSRGAAKCANIMHIWQLEFADMGCPEEAKSVVEQIQASVKEECRPMADKLLQEDNLPRALRQRSTALDGAPLYVPRVDPGDQRSYNHKLVITEAVDDRMSTVAAATLAWPKYQTGEAMALVDLSTQSGLGVVLPVGKWVCLLYQAAKAITASTT